MWVQLRNRLSSQWALSLTVLFLFGAALLRTLIIYQGRPELAQGVLLLAGWLLLFLSRPFLAQRWNGFFPLYLVVQTGVVVMLYRLPVYPDYFAVLLAILGMQIIQVYSLKTSTLCIAVFTPITVVMIVPSLGIGQALALGMMYTGVNALMASFAYTIRQAQSVKERNQALAQELLESNRQLEQTAARLKRLAVVRERGRLARELHDSVTQTLFSMTLTTQAALMLVDRDPGRVGTQMERLNQMGKNALAEMRLLISELGPEDHPAESLANSIRRHLQSNELPESLKVVLESSGEGNLTPEENKSLFRIVQEALNNTVKHAYARQVIVRLHLEAPYWVEIEDDGAGFDPQKNFDSSHLGLRGMQERAAAIGWQLSIQSKPGAHTQVRVEKICS